MPLIITASLNKKASRDFQSLGASISLAVELDSALMAHPEELQRAIDNVFDECRAALARQDDQPAPAAPPARRQPTNGNGYNGHANRFQNGNGHGRPNGQQHNNGHPASDKQRRAIAAIAREQGADPFTLARETFGLDLNALTGQQASQLIDSLRGN